MPTHNTGVPLPANLKYVSWNPVSRFLIRRFMAALVGLATKTCAGTILDVGCGDVGGAGSDLFGEVESGVVELLAAAGDGGAGAAF